MKKDIVNRTDIELMVDTFYKCLLTDKKLSFFFQGVSKVSWINHIPLLYNFWDNVILFAGDYEGNPIDLHKHMHFTKPLNKTHFDRWNRLFIRTVDQLFEGSNAELAKERAINISGIIMITLLDCQRTPKVKRALDNPNKSKLNQI